MDADELIARLAAEGELEGSGTFTLDPAVALDKLREFQLRDPTRFVLSWVRAATLLGATRVDIEIDADDVWFRFDGESLTGADFDSLWSSALGGRGSARLRACRELALGINGAFTWEAKAVSVQSGELRVSFDGDFEMTRASVDVSAGEPANVVHAKRPIGWDLVRRVRLDARGELPEELLLAQACAHAKVPIYLEGKLLNPPRAEPPGTWLRVEIDDDGRRGHLRMRLGERSQLRVLVSGVEVAQVELPYAHGFVEAVVDDPLLPLDLAQEKPVEGERWQALLDCVSRARWQAWFILAKREGWPTQPLGTLFKAGQDAIVADIFASPDTGWLELPGAMAFADRLEVARAVSDPYADFRALGRELGTSAFTLLPWPPALPAKLTLGELLRSARRHGVLFTSSVVLDELPFEPELPVLLHRPTLGLRALGGVVLDRPATVARYKQAVAELRPLSGDRPLPEAWLQQRYRCGEYEVRVAWKRGCSRDRGALIVGREGKCLARYCLPPSWGPLWAEVEGPFAGDPEPALDEQIASAVLALLERHHDLIAALDGEQLSPGERELVQGYLRTAFARWSAQRLAELTDIPADARTRAIAAWRGGWGVPPEWVNPPPRERAACAHPLMNLAWLARGDRHVCLRDIQRELARHSPLPWVERGAADERELPPEVWRLSADERAIISDLFFGAFERFDRHAWARRERGSFAIPTRLDGARASVVLRGEAGERGILAIPEREVPSAWRRPPRRGARLRLLARWHDLGWMDVPLPVGPFYGVIEIPNARAVAHADLALKDEAWRTAAALVEARALELARGQLDAWIAGRHGADELARVTDWLLDLDRGGWPELAAALRSWQAGLAPDHPLHVNFGN